MANTLNKTKNFYKAIGTVNELALKVDTCMVEQKDAEGNSIGKVETDRIMGTVSLKVGDGVMSFNTYQTKLNSYPDKNGKYDNPRWKMAEDMLKWNPKINGNPNENSTVVELSGSVAINDYLNKEGKAASVYRWTISKATTKVSGDVRGASASLVGYIDSIKPEVVKEEETGRLKVTIYCADGKGECFPVRCIVEEDMADDFTDLCSIGQTIDADFDIVCTHVGGSPTTKKQFGRNSNVTLSNGYDRTEVILVGADVIEEPDELTVEDENGNEVPVKTKWIDPTTMKKAIKVRKQKLEELANKAENDNGETPKKSNSTANKLKDAKKAQYQFDDDDDGTDPF